MVHKVCQMFPIFYCLFIYIYYCFEFNVLFKFPCLLNPLGRQIALPIYNVLIILFIPDNSKTRRILMIIFIQKVMFQMIYLCLEVLLRVS